jgi:hypothetical protein
MALARPIPLAAPVTKATFPAYRAIANSFPSKAAPSKAAIVTRARHRASDKPAIWKISIKSGRNITLKRNRFQQNHDFALVLCFVAQFIEKPLHAFPIAL